MIKIIYFYTSVTGYVLSTLREVYRTGMVADIYLVYYEKNVTNGNNFSVKSEPWLHLIPRHTVNDHDLFILLRSIEPAITYISGWVDKGYITSLSRFRSGGGVTITVCGIDDQWKGSLRQYLGLIYYKLFLRSLFDYMWVSGKPQYHFAQRFGYNHSEIICNLYSADSFVFNKKVKISRRFVFVGRFIPAKGIELLINAYNNLPEPVQNKWPLVLIGDGALKSKIESHLSQNITVQSFLQPLELKEELGKGGVACVPSHDEQWGVVIHEMSLLGYPLVVSSACGAATEFLINGYNGFLFKSNEVNSLTNYLTSISSFSDDELELFSSRSRGLGLRVTPQHSAFSLLSVIS